MLLRIFHRIKRETLFFVVIPFQIEQYGSAFEDRKIVAGMVDQDWEAPVWV